MKKMMERQLSSLPPDQKEKIIQAFTNNPEFFARVAEDIEKEVRAGKDRMAAAQEVLLKNQQELTRIFQPHN